MKDSLMNALAVTIAGSMFSIAAQAHEPGKLSIWINGDKGYRGLQMVGDQFENATGIPVQVSHPDDATGKFQQAAATGQGPDIFIWAHDRYGEWVQAGLLQALTPSKKVRKGIVEFAWDAVTIGGNVYGYPMAIEAVGLIYNKDLVASAPRTFEEIFALDKSLAKEGKKAILWDYNNTYYTWGMMAANGGYAFAKENGVFNPRNSGVNADGAMKGAAMLHQMVVEGLMPVGVDYAASEAAFNSGKVAMTINGPWAWSNMKKSQINFGVTTIPSVNGKVSRPFVGITAAMVNASTTNKDIAIEFIENYMITVAGLKTINADVELGAVANKEFMKELGADTNIAATFKNAELGKPMPNIPEMGKFWSAMGPALSNITSGRQDVKSALDAASKRIVK